ncbi:MAG: ArsR family transcriptional regulator [Saprospiraceae bacterium]
MNSNTTAYLRSLEGEFGESTNGIRIELNRMESAGMLTSKSVGNKKVFQANTQYPLYKEINSIIMKYVGLDRIIENVVSRLGAVEHVYLAGEFSKGLDSQVIDLIFIGDVDKSYLVTLIEKSEELVKRKIRYLVYSSKEVKTMDWGQFSPEPLLLWSKD